MMRNTITRTIETSRIYFAMVAVNNGAPEFVAQPSIVVNGKYSTEEAGKLLKKKYKGQTVVVTDVEYTETLYEISVEDFIKYATPVSK